MYVTRRLCEPVQDASRLQSHVRHTDRDEVLSGYDGGAHGLFSNSSAVSPDYHNYIKVYVRYCDGGSFSGDTVSSTSDGTLHFRGRRILDVVLDDLVQEQGLKGELLINGCSAGGLAVWLHLDYIAARLLDVRVLGIPECGFFSFFMDLPTFEGQPKHDVCGRQPRRGLPRGVAHGGMALLHGAIHATTRDDALLRRQLGLRLMAGRQHPWRLGSTRIASRTTRRRARRARRRRSIGCAPPCFPT